MTSEQLRRANEIVAELGELDSQIKNAQVGLQNPFGFLVIPEINEIMKRCVADCEKILLKKRVDLGAEFYRL